MFNLAIDVHVFLYVKAMRELPILFSMRGCVSYRFHFATLSALAFLMHFTGEVVEMRTIFLFDKQL